MERYKVSGEDLRNFYQGDTNLSKVFADIENDLRDTNAVVCRFIVNGMEIKESDEARFGSVSLKDVETLEYMTENSNDLVLDVLRAWIDSLPELMGKTENLSKRMRAQGLSGLLKPIHDLVSNCEYLIDSVMSLKVLVGDRYLVASPVNWAIAEEQSKKTVTEALGAMENKDFVLLADVLEYDLNNVLQMWKEHLQYLEKALNGDINGSNFKSEQDRSNPVGWKRIAN
ncbi:hypothetical protein DOM22_02715 [Bdellovibrio sp. ZAP7]|uniref:hypothetical protein n=1 Tax=Bdellovibrio sp. ZAP7 TaxID=2231053 RepID=UPI001157F5FF|nr:hypothetical protein [Bdellovibrio sp. ZAP7]QDK44141.1 hypothetical protein DOM22_02715 [Bdellovibrio sp. ZAP7]